VTVLIGGFWALAISKALRVRRQPVAVGPQRLGGLEGVVRDDGFVFVHGELWRARSDDRLVPGEKVKVDRVDGLTLEVHRIEA
jgi:membrane-bound serine protease (ClpP class)